MFESYPIHKQFNLLEDIESDLADIHTHTILEPLSFLSYINDQPLFSEHLT